MHGVEIVSKTENPQRIIPQPKEIAFIFKYRICHLIP